MPDKPTKGHQALRAGRWSQPGVEYFLTICTTRTPEAHLDDPEITAAILRQLLILEAENLWRVRTAVVMPDHVHILASLGEPAELSGSVRLLKGRLTPTLRAQNTRWEHGYFDHRIRADEDRLPLFLYIFLNPYRKNLIAAGQRWGGYYCSHDDWAWFSVLTDNECAFPEWLG